MRFIQHFRPLLELGSCKEYVMAKKITDTTKRRTRKAASVVAPEVLESRQESVPVSKAPVSKAQVSNLQEEIRRRAYELYLQRGGVPGNENQDWLVAEQEVRSRQMEHVG